MAPHANNLTNHSTNTTSRFGSRTPEYPTLKFVTPRSSRTFLVKYDPYVREIIERHEQRVSTNDADGSVEPPKPVSLKFCVDACSLQAAIVMGIIKDRNGCRIESLDSLTDSDLRSFFESKAKASKDNVTVQMLDKLVEKSLRMDMRDKCPMSPMENLFVNYFVLLKRHGCEWVINTAQTVAVRQVLSKIKPSWLHNRIKSDLCLSHSALKSKFSEFRDHCIKLAGAMAVLDDRDHRDRNARSNASTSTGG